MKPKKIAAWTILYLCGFLVYFGLFGPFPSLEYAIGLYISSTVMLALLAWALKTVCGENDERS